MSSNHLLKRKAKIVATIGPASRSEQKLRELIQAGMNVARLNFSHGSQKEHGEVIDLIRQISSELSTPVMIFIDLQGPKLRVGTLPANGIFLSVGSEVYFSDITSNKPLSTIAVELQSIPISIPGIFSSLDIDHRILLDDGKIEIKITQTADDHAIGQVIVGGSLTSNKGINLPDTSLSISAYTEKDRLDLSFGLSKKVDAFALSFIRTSDEISTVRSEINSLNKELDYNPYIIAKIEKPEAITNIDSIIDASDGIMVARGDLAIETSINKVPVYQKLIVEKANQQNKFVIIATQMLESMTSMPIPTRAEASDVANAVLDNADALMLSGETAIGKYPVETLERMSSIILETEQSSRLLKPHKPLSTYPNETDSLSIARAASELALDSNVSKIFIFTVSGKTAQQLSQTRTEIPLVAFTPNAYTLNKLSVLWGIETHKIDFSSTLDSMIATVDQHMKLAGLQQPGDQVIIVCGYPFGEARPPNFLYLHTLV